MKKYISLIVAFVLMIVTIFVPLSSTTLDGVAVTLGEGEEITDFDDIVDLADSIDNEKGEFDTVKYVVETNTKRDYGYSTEYFDYSVLSTTKSTNTYYSSDDVGYAIIKGTTALHRVAEYIGPEDSTYAPDKDYEPVTDSYQSFDFEMYSTEKRMYVRFNSLSLITTDEDGIRFYDSILAMFGQLEDGDEYLDLSNQQVANLLIGKWLEFDLDQWEDIQDATDEYDLKKFSGFELSLMMQIIEFAGNDDNVLGMIKQGFSDNDMEDYFDERNDVYTLEDEQYEIYIKGSELSTVTGASAIDGHDDFEFWGSITADLSKPTSPVFKLDVNYSLPEEYQTLTTNTVTGTLDTIEYPVSAGLNYTTYIVTFSDIDAVDDIEFIADFDDVASFDEIWDMADELGLVEEYDDKEDNK